MRDQRIEKELKERREQILREKANGKAWVEQWQQLIRDEANYFKAVK